MSDIIEFEFEIDNTPSSTPYEAELREDLDILYILDFDRDGMTKKEAVVADALKDYLTDNRGDIAKTAVLPIADVAKNDKMGRAIIKAKPLAALIHVAVEDNLAKRRAKQTSSKNNAIDFKTAVLMAVSGDEIVRDMTPEFLEFIVTCHRWVSRM